MNLVLLLLFVPAVLTAGGLAIDSGQVFVARREAQGIADAAARAGAGEIDLAAARRNPTGPVRLDPPAARAAAASYVAIQRPGFVATVRADAQRARVRVIRTVDLTFMRLVGFSTARVEAEGSAEPRAGITAAQPR